MQYGRRMLDKRSEHNLSGRIKKTAINDSASGVYGLTYAKEGTPDRRCVRKMTCK
jgi:hypothetical protein